MEKTEVFPRFFDNSKAYLTVEERGEPGKATFCQTIAQGSSSKTAQTSSLEMSSNNTTTSSDFSYPFPVVGSLILTTLNILIPKLVSSSLFHAYFPLIHNFRFFLAKWGK